MEVSEQMLDPERRNQMIGNYMESSREANAPGSWDMANYYREKAIELAANPEQEQAIRDQTWAERADAIKEYYAARKVCAIYRDVCWKYWVFSNGNSARFEEVFFPTFDSGDREWGSKEMEHLFLTEKICNW